MRNLLLMCAQQEKERYAQSQTGSFDYIFKWNPRQQDKQAILNDAIQSGTMTMGIYTSFHVLAIREKSFNSSMV